MVMFNDEDDVGIDGGVDVDGSVVSGLAQLHKRTIDNMVRVIR